MVDDYWSRSDNAVESLKIERLNDSLATSSPLENKLSKFGDNTESVRLFSSREVELAGILKKPRSIPIRA